MLLLEELKTKNVIENNDDDETKTDKYPLLKEMLDNGKSTYTDTLKGFSTVIRLTGGRETDVLLSNNFLIPI